MQSNADEQKITKLLASEPLSMTVEVAGMGGAGGDITATKGDNLWIIEVKGNNNKWMSTNNQKGTGNVPAKQLYNKLSPTLSKTDLGFISSSPSDAQKFFLNLLLATTGIGDYNFLYVKYNSSDESSKITGHGPINSTIMKAVFNSKEPSYEKLEAMENNEVYNFRNWVIQNAEDFIDVVGEFTDKLKNMSATERGKITALQNAPQLNKDEELVLIPVLDFNDYKNQNAKTLSKQLYME